jgi:Tannase and feruloyl esterase
MGHTGGGWLFAYDNLQGQADFADRATHLTAVVAKQLIKAFYGSAASRNHFNGCSTGGRQAMIAAQRFPHDFEGIIAGARSMTRWATRPTSSSGTSSSTPRRMARRS